VVQLWNVDAAPRYVRSFTDLTPLAEQTEAIQSLAFSPDGTLLAASDKSQTTSLGHTSTALVATMAIWRISSGGTVAPITDLGGGNSLNGSDVIAFSPDGKRLAATLLTGGVRIYDPLGGQLLRTLSDPGDDGVSLAFGPKGILAEGTIGGTVELWRPTTGKRVMASPLLADSVAITSVAFDPTGHRFATAGSGDGTIKVWFTAGLQQEAKLASDPDATSAAAFEPGGKALLVVDDRGGAFAWPTSLTAWQQDACALAGRNLTRAEWTQFVAGPRYTSVCP
jgi:WD40 repeat protein